MSVDQQQPDQQYDVAPELIDAYQAQYFPHVPRRARFVPRQVPTGAVPNQPVVPQQVVPQPVVQQPVVNQPVVPQQVVPQRPVITPAKQNFDLAKQGFDRFMVNPTGGWTVANARDVKALRQEMIDIAKAELAGKDDVSRKVMLMFDSSDEQYKLKVTALIKKTLNDIAATVNEPLNNTGGAIKTLNEALDALAIQRAHYADTRGINPKETELLAQRTRKVQAIDDHMGELKEINTRLRAALKMKTKPALDLLATLPALAIGDPQQSQQAIQDLSQSLNGNDQMRQDLFQAAGPEHCQALCQLLRANDPWCKELAIARADDPAFMDPLCKTAILAESGAAQKNTFFRGNTTATKLATAYAQNSPGGKAYCQNACDRFAKLAKGKGTLELDDSKDAKLKDKDIRANQANQKEILAGVIDGVTGDLSSVPPEIAKICKTFHDEALRVSKGNNAQASAEDEEFATTQSGGFLMLRVVCPSMVDPLQNELNRLERETDYTMSRQKAENKWRQEGKDMQKFKYPDPPSEYKKAKEQLRLVTLQSKVLQNMSNGVQFKTSEEGGKEPYMVPMNDVIKQGDQFAPDAAKLRGFLKRIAQ